MTASEDDALSMIKKNMYDHKKYSPPPPPGQKKKRIYSEKEMKAVAEAFKNLSKDNVMLKNSVKKLVDRDDQNKFKISQFDNLVNQYHVLSEENKKLNMYLEILKQIPRDKCTTDIFTRFNPNNNGGPGVF